MNWKGFGRKPPWPNFQVLSRHSPGGTEKNHDKSGYPVSTPRFEPETSRIQRTTFYVTDTVSLYAIILLVLAEGSVKT
jgi:hypothetical protein